MSKKQYNFILKALFILFIFSVNSAFSQENNIDRLVKENTLLQVEIETKSKTTANEVQLMEKKNPYTVVVQENNKLKVSSTSTTPTPSSNNTNNDPIPAVEIDNVIFYDNENDNQTNTQSSK